MKNSKLAINVTFIAIGMVCLSYAAFPLYNLFCRVTGYGGTTQQSEQYSQHTGTRDMTIRFNADVSSDLDWDFKPAQSSVQIKTGENKLAFYEATNRSGVPLTGVATYNVVPDQAGEYFQKIECFCFTEQTLNPGQTVQMPMSFFIDPKIEHDPALKNLSTITLSYTFFPNLK